MITFEISVEIADLPQVKVLPVFSVTRHSWLTGTGWGLDSTSANASTMHFITCRGRNVHEMSQKTFFAATFSHEPDHHKWVDESVILLSAQILPGSDGINPHSFPFSLTAALAVNSKTFKKKKKTLRWEIRIISTPIVLFDAEPIPHAWWFLNRFFSFSHQPASSLPLSLWLLGPRASTFTVSSLQTLF